ncbi:MAG: hypothetical protein ACYCW6_00970 [Candidatus Xenobia bacterium]
MERRVRIDRVVTTHASGQVVEYRADRVEIGKTPGEFERHYARVMEGREALERSEIEAALHGEERVLMRTLVDYEAGVFWKPASIVEQQETRALLGSRVEEVEVSLQSRIDALESMYRIETGYAALEAAFEQSFRDWDRQCGSRGFLIGPGLERLIDDPLIRQNTAIALACLITYCRNSDERVVLKAKDESLFADRLWLGETWLSLRERLAKSARDLGPRPDPAPATEIWENPNGTFSVRFPEGVVTVTPPTDTELLVLNNSGRDGCWATVVHKAVLELQQLG